MKGVCVLLLVCMGATLAVSSTSSLPSKDPTKVLMKRDYKAPPQAVDPPPQGYGAQDHTDNGYYYYYYPVEEDIKKDAKAKDECTIKKLFVPLVIITIFLGIIAFSSVGLIPRITLPAITLPIPVPAGTGNAGGGRSLAEAVYDNVPWNSLELLTIKVSEAIEGDECWWSRIICESGRYFEGSNTALSLLEFIMPPGSKYQNSFKIFKDASLKKTDCRNLQCSYAEEENKV